MRFFGVNFLRALNANIANLILKVTNYRIHVFHSSNKALAFIVQLDNIKEVGVKVNGGF